MSKSNVASAILDRWNDRGLDADIAPLWRAASEFNRFGRTNGVNVLPFGSNPENAEGSQTIPRAEFAVGLSDIDEETIGFKQHSAPVEIRVFGEGAQIVEDWLDRIDSEFDFGDKAGTNPVAMDADEATIILCRSCARSVNPYAKSVWVGELVFEVHWARDVVVPS